VATPGTLHRQLTPLEPVIRRIEDAQELDEIAQTIGGKAREVLAPGTAKDLLSGTWLGHAVHPMLTDVVIGSFVSSTMLDLIGSDGDGRAQRRLLALGIAAYAPTALTGVNDWADTEAVSDGVRRAGLVHASVNAVALTLEILSLRLRRRGRHRAGAFAGALGASVMMAGGYLGGHLSFTKGVGPDQTVFDSGPSDWTQAAAGDGLQDGQPLRVVVEDTPVLLLRAGENLFAIHDRCSHRGCSLSDGEVEGEEIVCSCHGSRFSLRDGSLRHGPATSPQPAFETRQQDGRIEIRRSA
jgi:nitrite reductase/ring-hydroxylating ferredoxin subunit